LKREERTPSLRSTLSSNMKGTSRRQRARWLCEGTRERLSLVAETISAGVTPQILLCSRIVRRRRCCGKVCDARVSTYPLFRLHRLVRHLFRRSRPFAFGLRGTDAFFEDTGFIYYQSRHNYAPKGKRLHHFIVNIWPLTIGA